MKPLSFLLSIARGLFLCTCVGLFIGFLVIQSGCQSANVPNTPEAREARMLYRHVWALIRSEFLDPTRNAQDWSRWEHRYDTSIYTFDDAYVAIDSMLASLNDPYSRFLPPKQAKDQDMNIDARLFGVGIQIAQRDGHIVIIAPLEGSPAAKMGIRPLDEIIAVNRQPIVDLPMEEVANRIRGPKGTPVTLTIVRQNKPVVLTIVRDEIPLKSVYGKPVSSTIGYIRIASFISQATADEFRKALLAQNNTQAMIIDLRGNNGGLLNNAVEVADMLLDKGSIVSIVGRGNDKSIFKAQPDLLYNKPIVVLIDAGSASASEILSGALKDNKRAKLIGTTTFGKGLVQKIFALPNGSEVNLTISKYLTPSGQNIDKVGISPDILVAINHHDLIKRYDRQKETAITTLKAALPN